jgi:hypothetical protein
MNAMHLDYRLCVGTLKLDVDDIWPKLVLSVHRSTYETAVPLLTYLHGHS